MAKLRCQPGDLARVIKSCNPALVRRIVLVGQAQAQSASWEVKLLGEPVFGVEYGSSLPIVTSDWLFPDSALFPLRGEEPEVIDQFIEVNHG